MFYSYIYDKSSSIHRITYYDNFQKKKNNQKKFRVTVEYISPVNKLDSDLINQEILNYLRKINLLKKNNKLSLVKNYNIPIPILNKSPNIKKKLMEIKNLFIFGKAGGTFSKQNIALDIYNKISKI